MGVTLTTKKLTKEAVKAMSAGQLDKFDVKKLRGSVVEYIEPVKKRYTMACVLLVAMFVLFTASSFANMSKNGNFDLALALSILAPIVLFLIVVYAALGWLSFGRIKGQFNRALKKGYPELFDELKL